MHEATDAALWTCAACGAANEARDTCLRCGVARWWSEDPPLDVPPAPTWASLPSTYLALLYAGLTVAGAWLGLAGGGDAWWASPGFVWTEAAFAAVGCAGALNHAAWARRLRSLRLEVPSKAAAGEPFEVGVRLVAYRPLEGVHLSLSLHDRFFHAKGEGRRRRVERRSHLLARHRHLHGGRLPGRRDVVHTSAFDAPFPLTAHHDTQTEMMASLLGLLGPIWPPAARLAANLREHGGYVVTVVVRHGIWRTTLERRVLVYHVGDTLHVG